MDRVNTKPLCKEPDPKISDVKLRYLLEQKLFQYNKACKFMLTLTGYNYSNGEKTRTVFRIEKVTL